MRFIEEIVVEEFLPTVRSMLAEALRDRGLTQQEVGAALGISQSAVSKYVHGDVTRTRAIESDDRVRRTVETIADGLADGDLSPVGALVELEVLIRSLEQPGEVLASRHEAANPELAAHDRDFSIHDPESPVRRREAVLASVRRALRLLEDTAGVAGLIPAVGSNLVEALPDATDLEEVAGVPGRIVDVKGHAMVPADPEFGVSGHVASVLLGARAAGSGARGAFNLRYDPALVQRLRDAGHVAVRFDPGSLDGGEAVRAAVAEHPDATVVYQTGEMGVEPIIYLLAADAPAVVRTVRDLLE